MLKPLRKKSQKSEPYNIFSSSQLSEIADACLEDFSDIDAAIKAFRDTKLKKELDSTGKSYDIKPVGGFDP